MVLSKLFSLLYLDTTLKVSVEGLFSRCTGQAVPERTAWLWLGSVYLCFHVWVMIRGMFLMCALYVTLRARCQPPSPHVIT